MKILKSKIFKFLLPILSVWLFAIYPILVLYAHNIEEVVLNQITLPIILSLVSSTILFVLWSVILKSTLKASLATVFLMLILWYYGLVYTGITSFTNLKHWHLIPLILFVYFNLVYLITNIKQYKTLKNLNAIFLFPISLLILFNLIAIFPVEIEKYETLNDNSQVSLRELVLS
jgi:hypothetical protein